MKEKFNVCFCATTIKWIAVHLQKSARDAFSRMVVRNSLSMTPRVLGLKRVFKKKRRTAKQIAATRKLVAWGKKHRRRRR